MRWWRKRNGFAPRWRPTNQNTCRTELTLREQQSCGSRLSPGRRSCAAASTAQRKHHFSPTVENHVDADEETDDPQSRNRPRTHDRKPEEQRNRAIQDEPSAMMNRGRERDEESEGAGDDEQHRDHEGQRDSGYPGMRDHQNAGDRV